MADFAFKLPDVGEGVAEAEIVEWKVAVGDVVGEDQPVVDVMTDKATVELPSPVAGTIARLGAEVGEVVPVGSTLVWIDVDRDGPSADTREAGQEAVAPEETGAEGPGRAAQPDEAQAVTAVQERAQRDGPERRRRPSHRSTGSPHHVRSKRDRGHWRHQPCANERGRSASISPP